MLSPVNRNFKHLGLLWLTVRKQLIRVELHTRGEGFKALELLRRQPDVAPETDLCKSQPSLYPLHLPILPHLVTISWGAIPTTAWHLIQLLPVAQKDRSKALPEVDPGLVSQEFA